MSGAVLNGIFLLVSGLGLIPLVDKLFAPPQDQITTVRVTLGQNATVSTGGNLPGIALWDDDGRSIGTTFGSSKILPEGTFTDIKVVAHPDVGNVKPTYLSITNGGDDAICISGLAITLAGGQRVAWSADIAAQCSATTGAFIYTGQDAFGASDGVDSKNRQAYCVWIDRNGSGGIPHQGIGIHLPDFAPIAEGQVAAYANNTQLLCDSGPRFRMYPQLRAENPILTYQPVLKINDDGTDADPAFIIGNPGVFAQQDQQALKAACRGHAPQAECSAANLLPSVPRLSQEGGALGVVKRQLPPGKRFVTSTVMSTQSTATSEASSTTTATKRRVSSTMSARRSTTFGRSDKATTGSDAGSTTNSGTSVSSTTTRTSATSTSISTGGAKNKFNDYVIISSKPFHSAKSLCDAPNSFGPSLASIVEGLFCDMIEKQLYPICDDSGNGQKRALLQENADCCFDTTSQTKVNCGIAAFGLNQAGNPDSAVRDRQFNNVQFW